MQTNEFDVRAARERLDLGPEALAAELRVTEGEVCAWENGTIRIPRNARKLLEYRVALAAWDAGMRASGLPECEWLKSERARAVLPLDHEEMIRLATTVKAHMQACEVCTARERWAKEHLPSYPMPPAEGAVAAATLMIQRLPPWARPAAWGALVLSAVTGVRGLVMLVLAGWHMRGVLEAAGAVLLAACAGGVGGLTYSLTRPAMRRLGAVGDYLSGIIAVTAYMGAVLLVLPLFGLEPILSDVAGLVIFAFVSVLFGTLVGKVIHDGERLKQAME